MDRGHQGEYRRQMRGRTRAVPAFLIALPVFFSPTAEAQLFNGGGLFNKKTEAPRVQTEDEIGVPVPVTGRVEALKGHEVQFEIRAESKTPGATVEFLIRAFPSAGKIVSLVSKPNERNKAVVTYYADPSSSANADAFSFAVRYRGGRYSAEMRYDIDLVDLKAEIQAPPEIDFDEVMVGSEAIREIAIRNLGNGSIDRQIFLPPPWHLVDPADGKVSIGPRGGRILKVAFRPELTGETSYFLSLSRSKEGTTKLLGRGGDPFRVASESLELVVDPVSGERRGEIEVVNPGARPVTVESRASSRLQNGLANTYLIVPGKPTRVPVNLGATDTAPFDGTVQFSLANGYSKSVRVFAPVVPGRIQVAVPNAISSEVINFGKVEAGRSTERGITVTNRGGIAVPLEFHIPEPFRLLTNPGPQLGSLSEVAISIGLFPALSARGPVDVTMHVLANEQTVPVRLLANVVPPAGAAPRSGAQPGANLPLAGVRLGSSTPAVPAASNDGVPEGPAGLAADPESSSQRMAPVDPPLSSAIGGAGANNSDGAAPGPSDAGRHSSGDGNQSVAGRVVDPDLRRPEDLSVFEVRSDSIMIGWTSPKDERGRSFEVEGRSVPVGSASGESRSVWVPYPAVKLERIDRLVKAKIEPLNPASQYEFRVVLTADDGRSSPPSEVLSVHTGSPLNLIYLWAFLGFALLVATVLITFKVVRGRHTGVVSTPYIEF